MVDLVLKGLLFLSPLAYAVDTPLIVTDLIFFRVGVVILFLASLFDTQKRKIDKPLLIAISSLLGIGIMNVFIHDFKPQVLSSLYNLFQATIAFAIIYLYCDKPEKCIKWAIGAAIINMAVYLLQRIGINPILNTPGQADTYGGLMGNSPRLTIYLSLLLGYMWYPLLIISALIGYLTGQYSLIIIAGLVLFYRYQGNIPKWTIIGLVFGVGFMYFFRQHLIASFQFRWDKAWYPVLVEFFKQPVIGYGMSVIPIKSSDCLASSYLQFIVGAGLAALAWFVYVFKIYWHKIDQYILPLIVLMTVEYLVEVVRNWFTVIVIIAFFMIRKEKENVGMLQGP